MTALIDEPVQRIKIHGIKKLPTSVISTIAQRFKMIPARLICGTVK